MKRTVGRVLAFLLALAICVSTMDMRVFATLNSEVESAQSRWDGITTESMFTSENSMITFVLTDYWEGGYNACIEIENIGETPIENWKLEFAFDNEIESIWNAEVSQKEENNYIIKNQGWNQDIAPCGSVKFGFGGTGTFKGFPETYELNTGKIGTYEDDYSIVYSVDNDWGSGFSGSVIISNGSQHIIEDWQISFRLDNDITHIWNGEILSHEGNHYVVKNQSFNQNIGANANVQFGFVVENGTAANEIYDVVLESSTIDAESNGGTDEEAGEDAGDSSEESEEGAGDGETDGTEDDAGEGAGEEEDTESEDSNENTDANI
ncbi:MAG: cellulose binding domain-containing protein, partial [Lachnospiraceae bacterium]|nr:cellulose binding domain-containing protein [Lachnospiraceae bacterium]